VVCTAYSRLLLQVNNAVHYPSGLDVHTTWNGSPCTGDGGGGGGGGKCALRVEVSEAAGNQVRVYYVGDSRPDSSAPLDACVFIAPKQRLSV
jgi:hypothetical protein